MRSLRCSCLGSCRGATLAGTMREPNLALEDSDGRRHSRLCSRSLRSSLASSVSNSLVRLAQDLSLLRPYGAGWIVLSSSPVLEQRPRRRPTRTTTREGRKKSSRTGLMGFSGVDSGETVRLVEAAFVSLNLLIPFTGFSGDSGDVFFPVFPDALAARLAFTALCDRSNGSLRSQDATPRGVGEWVVGRQCSWSSDVVSLLDQLP
jgi:hypothetical protein